MKTKVSPVVVAAAVIVVCAIVGFLSLKLFGNTGGSRAYTAFPKPAGLEQNVNAPPGLSAAGGGSANN